MSREYLRELGTVFRSAMLEKASGLFAWFGKRYFDHIGLDHDTQDRLRTLSERGTLVYVMRTRSTLDYLFFNYLFLKIGLPLARFANGIDLTFFRGIGLWISERWKGLFGRPDSEPNGLIQLTTTVENGNSALLFMRVRALTAERNSNPGFILGLVKLQRAQDRPILLLPQLVSWPRKPPSKKRTWFDIAFGDREASGRLRKFFHFMRSSRFASAQIGEPIDLQSVIEEHEGWSDERIARKVRRVLIIHLAHESMAISGPGVKPAATIKREILERRRFRDQLSELAEREGVPADVALQKANRHLREISASLNFEVLMGFSRFLSFVFDRIFDGIEVDQAGIKRVKEAARLSRSAPLILLPSHKSHMDYLVISWMFLNNEFIPPHIAAGANLSFFPLGTLFRRSGAFFLRRSFANAPFYKLVFKNYLWKLVREGYPLEFYMEGGRSRTGKLLPPKMGMLSMLLDGIRQGEFKDLQFIPINISYERVLETGAYRHELTGGAKTSESVTEVVRAGNVLLSRYGRVYVNIGEPVRLSQYLESIGVPSLSDAGDDHFRATTKRLGYHLMRQIHEAMVVTPSALVGAVLLSHHRRGLPASRLYENAGFILSMMMRRSARLSASIRFTLEAHHHHLETADAIGLSAGARARGVAIQALLDQGLALLSRIIATSDSTTNPVYVIPDKNRIELDYYRNPVMAVLAPDCIIATALLSIDEAMPRDTLSAEARRLSYWFRFEFIYETDTTFEENFSETLSRLEAEGIVRIDEYNYVHPSAPRALEFIRGMMLHLIEGYWVAADALRTLMDAPMSRADWLEFARERAEREFLQGELRRSEAASTAVLKNALAIFIDEGLVAVERRSGKKPIEYLSLDGNVSAEDLAFRRDDIGAFLLRLHAAGANLSSPGSPVTESYASLAVETVIPAPIGATDHLEGEPADVLPENSSE